MNYVYGYYGANDFRNYNNSLMHFGRKGMKWGKAIFGSNEEWNRQKANSRLQRDRFRGATTANAASAKKAAGMAPKYYRASKVGVAGGGTKAMTAYNRANAISSAKTAVTSGLKTAGYAAAYAANVIEDKIVTGLRMGYQALKKAYSSVIEFGKKLIGKVFGKKKKDPVTSFGGAVGGGGGRVGGGGGRGRSHHNERLAHSTNVSNPHAAFSGLYDSFRFNMLE